MADGLLNKASIILTPTGYKAGTLYNVAPVVEPYEDFDFARASVASRVNSSGLVEMVGRTLSSELVVNGDFATNSDWTIEAVWTISDGAAHGNGASGSSQELKQTILEVGSSYKFVYEIKNYVSGSVELINSGLGSSSGNNIYTGYGVATSTELRFRGSAFNGDIDNVSVIKITDTNNIPRISYDSNGANGHILLEPTSTNLITYSEDFSQSYWRKDKLTVTNNSIISPSGELNATLIQETSYTSSIPSFDLLNAISLSAGTYTFTFYVKNNNGRYLGISFGSSAQRVRTNFDFNTNTFKALNLSGTTTGTASFTTLGDYYRISITATFPSATVADTVLMPLATDTYPFFAFQDSDNRAFYLWGAQLEALFATSYIPTLSGSTVTRATETANGAGSATLINSTEGVLYAEIAALSNDGTSRRISLSDGSISNRVSLELDETSNKIKAFISSGGVSQILEYTASDLTQYNKIAIKYKVNDFALWVDGVERATDSSGAAPIGLSQLQLSNYNSSINDFYGKCKALAVFNEALSDAELNNLTG